MVHPQRRFSRHVAVAVLAASGGWLGGHVRAASELPAFPGAQGFGSHTPGGRGGRVIAVTTLADSGPGSFREAVTTKGRRTVVFHVGGEIRLKSHLRVTEPFVTIAGQTAPGTGITLRDAGFYINTHDVVVRFIRSRVGASLVEPFDTQDALQISGDDAHDIVVDHCSFSWSIDEGVGIHVPAHDVTFSWNIISEALRQPFTKEQIGKDRSHSMALILSGGPTRTTSHHNLLAHCNSRNPRIQGGLHAFVNNVVYDWGWLSGTFSRDPEVNFIGNYYKPGPASLSLKPICEEAGGMGRVFVKGNRGPTEDAEGLTEWERTVAAPAADHRAAEPFGMPPLEVTSAEQAYEDVLREAGAILPVRDAVDRRVVRQVRLEMGGKIDRPEDVGGYPPAESGPVPADGDGDGMPDDYEIAHGFDPGDAADGAGDADYDGYTNLEEYLEYLVQVGRTPRPDVFSIVYDPPSDIPLAVSAGDAQFGIHRVGRARPVYYTHAWFEDDNTITVRGRDLDMTTAELVPARYRRNIEATSDAMNFGVNEEGPRLVWLGTPPDAPILVTLFDPFPEDAPHPEHDDTIDAKRYGVIGGSMDVTDQLQAALDACAEQAGNRRVFVHKGMYRLGRIHIPSGVELHLGRGAMLMPRADEPNGGTVVFDGVEDAALTGPGAVDGGGAAGAPRTALVLIRNARHVAIEDVVVRDPSGPGIVIEGSQDVRLHRVRIIASPAVPESGGLMVDGSRDVTCRRSLIMGSGDGIVIDARGGGTPSENVAMREAVVLAGARGVVVGPEVTQGIRAVSLRDVDVVSAGQGVVVHQQGSGGIEGLVFQDMTMQLHAGTGDEARGRPFLVVNEPRSGTGVLRDVLFDRVHTNAWTTSRVEGTPRARVEDVKFWGVRVRTGTMSPPLFRVDHVRGAQFRFLYHHGGISEDVLIETGRVEELKAPPAEIFSEPGHADSARH